MKLPAYLSLLSVQAIGSLAFSGGEIARRDFATISSDFKLVSDDLTKSINDVNAYTGTSSQSVNVVNDLSVLDRDIKQTTTDCQASASSFTTAQGQSVANYCNNTFAPSWRSLVTALKNKRATFTSSGLTATVKSSLVKLRTDLNGAVACLTSAVPTAQKPALSSCAAKISADADDVVAYYS